MTACDKDETDELYDEAKPALFLAQEANKKALEVAQRLQYHVKDELSHIALQDLNSCVESCQNASQLIEESRSRRNETGLIDLTDDDMLYLMRFLSLSDILKLRLLSKSVYTFVTNLCGNCKVWKIDLPGSFLTSSGFRKQFDMQLRDYFINSDTDVKITLHGKLDPEEESIDLLERCAHRIISMKSKDKEIGMIPPSALKKIQRLQNLHISDDDYRRGIWGCQSADIYVINVSNLIMQNFGSVQKLDLKYIEPYEATDIMEMKEGLKELQVLDLFRVCGNNFILQLFRCKDSKLSKVHFYQADLTGLENLDTPLNNLKDIWISGCSFTQAAIVNLLTQSSQSLQCLDIDLGYLQSQNYVKSIHCNPKSLQCDLTSLSSLKIEGSDSFFKTEGCLFIENLLNCSPNLEKLDLSDIASFPSYQMQLKPSKLKSLSIYRCQIIPQLLPILLSCSQYLEWFGIHNSGSDGQIQQFFASQWYLPKLENLSFNNKNVKEINKDSFIPHVPDDAILEISTKNYNYSDDDGTNGLLNWQY